MRTNESLAGGRPCAGAPAHRENTISGSLAGFLDGRVREAREAACTTDRIEALNTDEPLIREDVQPCKVLRVDSDHEAYAESRLLEAATALQKAALVLGTPLMRCWFDEVRLARAQDDMLQIQGQMLAKLQRLNTRSLEALQASAKHGEGGDAA